MRRDIGNCFLKRRERGEIGSWFPMNSSAVQIKARPRGVAPVRREPEEFQRVLSAKPKDPGGKEIHP